MVYQHWKLNLLQHTMFSMALWHVLEMFEDTDKYPLARQLVLAGFISEAEVNELFERIGKCMQEERLKMSMADILLLYTVMDLNAKQMLSHKGDAMREQLGIDEEGDSLKKQGFEGMMQACSAFVQSINKEYGELPEFKQRQAELDKLNAFI